ncbi:uncharacterized protein LOC122524513 [Polistes fuscatus]|uniref:uncharacterized protein LOC122524513 n=1 Tax=Polistes fuscatus TaxID=30207 RepID=UPI001CA9C5D0|nr:uncharacterized protein LOC122524513 [Polistes fuscatus]
MIVFGGWLSSLESKLGNVQIAQISEGANYPLGKKAAKVNSYTVYSIRHFLDELNADFQKFQNQFIAQDLTEDIENEYEEYEEKFQQAQAIFEEAIDRKLNRSADQSLSQNNIPEKSFANIMEKQNELIESIARMTATPLKGDRRLPVLKIPTFTGNYKDWTKFKNVFRNIVHEHAGLSDSEKLNHLLSLLDGEPSNLIKHLPLTNENYSVAWDNLVERYERPYLIAHNIIKSLMKSPVVGAGNSNLSSLLDTVMNAISSLDSMSSYCRSRDPWIIYIITTKFDKDTAERWATHTHDNSEPTVEDMIEFLRERFDALELVAESHSVKPMIKDHKSDINRKSPLKNFSAFLGKCFVCQQEHKIFHCSKFRRMSSEERKHSRIKCGRHHHSLLHTSGYDQSVRSGTGPRPAESVSCEQNNVIKQSTSVDGLLKLNLGLRQQGTAAIIPTAWINARNSMGGVTKCRILLDSGDQASFISEDCLRRLRFGRSQVRVPVQFMCDGSRVYSKGSVVTILESVYDNSKKCSVYFHVLPKLTSSLPNRPLNLVSNKLLRERFDLADPDFHTPAVIDMVVGSDIFFGITGPGKYYYVEDKIWITESILGWLVSGGVGSPSIDPICFNHMNIGAESDKLDSVLERFWKMEEVEDTSLASIEDQKCEQIFSETTVRDCLGRYSVDLPIRSGCSEVGNSHHLSLNRYLNLEKKLKNDLELRDKYHELIKLFRDQGYMEVVLENELNIPTKNKFYLPHYGVDRIFKPSYQIFCCNLDAINSYLRPTFIKCIGRFKSTNLFEIFKGFFWRDSEGEEIREYRLTTVTGGESCSPFLALRTILQLSRDEAENFPLGTSMLSKKYMDDFFIGSSTIDDLIERRNELVRILASGGMKLCKWASNSLVVLRGIPSSDLCDPGLVYLEKSFIMKTLGLFWGPVADSFSFQYMYKDLKYCTKRTLLSETSRIFDPNGWISPVTFILKKLVQKTWIRHLDWDERLPLDFEQEWIMVRESLAYLKELHIPRYLGNISKSQIHGFCDASQLVRLLCSKTKLSPIKPISIARLELCGAHLLARLLASIKGTVMEWSPDYYCWCDSTTVLACLKSHPSRWNTFVANRCAHIHELCPGITWNYVKTTQNPADITTRGSDASRLIDNKLWWNGTVWLGEHIDLNLINTEFTSSEEERKAIINHASILSCDWTEWIERFSSWERLRRSFAYVLKFIDLCKGGKDNLSRELSSNDIGRATLRLICILQNQAFTKDIQSLKSKGQIMSSSRLRFLSPFLDENNLLRTGGRLKNAPISFESKHPIILEKGHFVELNRLHRCQTCLRYRGDTYSPMMGQLPEFRLIMDKPFQIVGIDFAGPVSLRPFKSRGKITIKGYIAVIICLATRALHLELVHSLDIESVVMALKRFIARRGRSSKIFSDNGRNFIVSSIGGIWEAAAKSVKFHLKRVLENLVPTIEEIMTLLTEIEAILNSRPLLPLSDKAEEMEILTPSHLISGYPSVDLPVLISDSNPGVSECQRKGREPVVGELVLIKRKDDPPAYWSRGRIVELHSGEDGISRVVDIRTAKGIKREMNKDLEDIIKEDAKDFDEFKLIATTIRDVKSMCDNGEITYYRFQKCFKIISKHNVEYNIHDEEFVKEIQVNWEKLYNLAIDKNNELVNVKEQFVHILHGDVEPFVKSVNELIEYFETNGPGVVGEN